MSKLRWCTFPLDLARHNRDDPLAVFYRAIDFLSAHFGFGRIRVDEEGEGVRFFDALLDLPPSVHSGRDAFPIDPEVQLAFL